MLARAREARGATHLCWEPDAVVVVALDGANEETAGPLNRKSAGSAAQSSSASRSEAHEATKEKEHAPVDALAALDVRLEELGRVVGEDDLRGGPGGSKRETLDETARWRRTLVLTMSDVVE